MLTVDEEIRIVEAAPPYLRVAIVLLSQTGGRTYSEGLSLRWDQVGFDQQLEKCGTPTRLRVEVQAVFTVEMGRSIYTLRHVFCTGLSAVAPDAVAASDATHEPRNQADLPVRCDGASARSR